MTTLNELFPGQTGRLELMRVMLKLRMPELRTMPRDVELPVDLDERLRTARKAIRRG